jgi:hypothetical protein
LFIPKAEVLYLSPPSWGMGLRGGVNIKILAIVIILLYVCNIYIKTNIMAVSRNNVVVKNFHGRVGNIVLRVFGNKTVMSCLPTFKNRKWSKAQLECQNQFRKATKFGHKVLADPELDLFYKNNAKENQSSWNASISDYMLKPEIENIDTSDYNGHEGDTIKVEAFDKFKVVSVIVMIINALGLQIEVGAAVQMPTGEWVYKVSAENPDWKVNRIVVKVSDLPGNVVQGEAVLDGT